MSGGNATSCMVCQLEQILRMMSHATDIKRNRKKKGKTMTRLIDADALLDFLDVGHLRPPTEICFSELMMKNIIDIQPTVDAVPVRHGKWIHRWSGCGSTWLEQKCSVCGVVFEDEPNDYSYCQNCGARMDEE